MLHTRHSISDIENGIFYISAMYEFLHSQGRKRIASFLC